MRDEATFTLLDPAIHAGDFNSFSHTVRQRETALLMFWVLIMDGINTHAQVAELNQDTLRGVPTSISELFFMHSGSVAWLFPSLRSRPVSLDDTYAHLHSTGSEYSLPLLIGKPQR